MKKFILLVFLLIPHQALSKSTTEQKENLIPKKEIKITYDLTTLLPGQEKKTSKNLTLEEAINTAYKNRPSLEAFKENTRSAQKLANSKMAGYLPQVQATYSSVDNLTKPEGAFFSLASFNTPAINIQQLIYSPAGPQDEYKIQMKDVKSSKYYEAAHKDLIRHQVEYSFLQTWLLDKKRKVISALGKASDEVYSRAKTQYKTNLLSQQEILQNEAQNYADHTTINSYFNQLFPSWGRLEYFLGKKLFCHNLEEEPLFWDYHQEVVAPENLESFCNLSIENRKEIKAKNEQIEKANLQSNYYSKKNLPAFSVSSTLGKKEQYYAFNVSCNLFDGLASRFTSDAYNAQKIKAEMEKKDLIQKIKLEVEEAYYALKIMIRELESKTIALKSAKNNLDLAQDNLKAGLITTIELDLSKEKWEQAQYQWLEYRVGVELKKSDLNFVCGYPSKIS